MGLEFGNLPIRIRKILYQGLSHKEQKVYDKMISHELPNLIRRAIIAVPAIAPAFIITTCTYFWALAEHDRSSRKDPKLYENDK